MEANFLNGIAFGIVLFLLATGLTLSLGLMGYLNLAHGALYMFSGLFGASIYFRTGSFLLALLASLVVAGLVGLVIERLFLRRLAGQPGAQVLLTIGFLFVLENTALWIWGPIPFDPATPTALAGTLTLPFTGALYPIYRIVLIFIGVAIGIGFWYFARTRVGGLIRAGMDDSQMIEGIGINISKIHIFVFAIASAAAGGAAMLALPLLGINVTVSFNILLLAIIVTVVGGMGSVLGSFVFALIVGVITSVGKILFPEFSMFLIYAVMVIVLAFKPSGLFGR